MLWLVRHWLKLAASSADSPENPLSVQKATAALRSAERTLSDCGKKYQDESRKWYAKYKNAYGVWQREPGFSDKEATVQLAAELERKAEHIQSGLADPHEHGKRRKLSAHLEEFRTHLRSEANSEKHVTQTCNRITRVIEGCGFSRWFDIVASELTKWLAEQRVAKRMGTKTSNYYLAAFKQFCGWLETDGRVPKKQNPVEHLSSINAEADIKWERRAISPEEFARLVAAAAAGLDVQCVQGTDRAMLYVMAAWTGYRRKELASLSLKSFDFDSEPATVRVRAGYSKRGKNDIVPLHPVVVERLQEWLASKGKLKRDEPLFNLRSRGGSLRRTSKMMMVDLANARTAWIEEAKTEQEREAREESDFLQYCDENGMYADFHANRHTFITNLANAGVHPKVAQSIARHSDVNLTMGIYSHVEIAKQSDAINALPAPPNMFIDDGAAESGPRALEAADTKSVDQIVDQTFDFACLSASEAVVDCPNEASDERKQKPLPEQGLVVLCQAMSPDATSSGGGTRTPDTRIMIPLL